MNLGQLETLALEDPPYWTPSYQMSNGLLRIDMLHQGKGDFEAYEGSKYRSVNVEARLRAFDRPRQCLGTNFAKGGRHRRGKDTKC